MKKEEKNIIPPLVAIDFGSSSLKIMAAEVTSDGESFRVLGVETSNKYACVEQGGVSNKTQAGYMISETLLKLNNRIGGQEDIQNIFLVYGGRSMRVAIVRAKRDQVYACPISDTLLAGIHDECERKVKQQLPNCCIYTLQPYKFTLDDKEQDYEPNSSQRATVLQAEYIAIIGDEEVLNQLEDSVHRTMRTIEGKWTRQEALAAAIVPEEEASTGCAIIDFGADTTTLTIYKNYKILSSRVVNMGGRQITLDIANQGISKQMAEQVKVKCGWASSKQVTNNQNIRVKKETGINEYALLSTTLIADIINERLRQTLSPIMDVLKKYENRIGKVYITGGASRLRGLVSYLREQTNLDVSFGSHYEWLTEDVDKAYCAPEYSSLVGALILGDEYRKAHPLVSNEGKTKKKKFFEHLSKTKNIIDTNQILDIFAGSSYENEGKNQ